MYLLSVYKILRFELEEKLEAIKTASDLEAKMNALRQEFSNLDPSYIQERIESRRQFIIVHSSVSKGNEYIRQDTF